VLNQEMADVDPTDFVALQPLGEELARIEQELEDGEKTWLEWADLLGS
jgi:hypothetical protein